MLLCEWHNELRRSDRLGANGGKSSDRILSRGVTALVTQETGGCCSWLEISLTFVDSDGVNGEQFAKMVGL